MSAPNRWVQVEFYAQLPEGDPLDVTGLSQGMRAALTIDNPIFREIEGITFSVQTDSPYYGKLKTGRHSA